MDEQIDREKLRQEAIALVEQIGSLVKAEGPVKTLLQELEEKIEQLGEEHLKCKICMSPMNNEDELVVTFSWTDPPPRIHRRDLACSARGWRSSQTI